MKIERILAKNAKEAMCLVKETYGSDAVILSSKNTKQGFEILVSKNVDTNNPGDLENTSESNSTILELKNDFNSLKGLVQEQLSSLVWDHKKRLEPHEAVIIRKLIGLGFSSEVADRVSRSISRNLRFEEINEELQAHIENSILPVSQDKLTDRLIQVFLGSSGSGKTLSIAKLATQYSLRFGSQDIAFISTDLRKIGGYDQLKTYANILNVPILQATSSKEIENALRSFKNKKNIFIDTPGVNEENIKNLNFIKNIGADGFVTKKYLVLSASTQTSLNEMTVDRFGNFQVYAGIISKTDEVSRLGDILSVFITSQLPLEYLCDSNNIPDGIVKVCISELVKKTLNMPDNKQLQLSENNLARAYSGVYVNDVRY